MMTIQTNAGYTDLYNCLPLAAVFFSLFFFFFMNETLCCPFLTQIKPIQLN